MAEETMNEESSQQNQYNETPYEDASWEIVGEVPEVVEFVPLEVSVISGEALNVDPMFADYGGIPDREEVRRWHLPEGVAYEDAGKTDFAEEENVEPKIELREEELEQIKQQAFQEGKISGLEEAVEQNAKRLEAMEERFAAIFPDLQQQISEVLRQTEENAVELALNISHKIIETAVEINPEYILRIIQEALSQTGTSVVRKVRISPQDMEFIEVVGLDKQFDSEAAWDWEADETIKSGCVVETSAGEIDYQIDQAWERIKDQVVKVIR